MMISRMIILANSKVIIDFIPEQREDNYKAENYIATYCIDTLREFLKDYNYTIELSEVPNPMTEALLTISLE